MTKAIDTKRHPERIYGWLETQLSIARFYGGIRYEGRMYLIDTEDPRQPLVRSDVLDAEKKQRMRLERTRRQGEAIKAAMAQGDLL